MADGIEAVEGTEIQKKTFLLIFCQFKGLFINKFQDLQFFYKFTVFTAEIKLTSDTDQLRYQKCNSSVNLDSNIALIISGNLEITKYIFGIKKGETARGKS